MTAATIKLRLASAAQLFHTLDPSPFRDADLAAEAEEYIVDWARELPRGQAIRVVIQLPQGGASGLAAPDLGPPIRNHFARKAGEQVKAIRELFRFGRRALAIGLAILSACLLIAWAVTDALADRPLVRVVQESFVIVGWVAIWRPAEVFLYDWLPLARRRDVLRRLAEAEVVVRWGD